MPLISTLLCSFALLVVGTATAGAQTVALFAVDPEYGWPRNVNNPDNAGTNLGLIGGAILAAQNKRETELSIEFRDAIQLDDLDLLVDLVRVPEVYGSSEIVRLDTLNDDTIANVLLERGLEEALLVRHYVASGGSFVARLVVERVSQQPRGVRRLHVATTYYYAALPQTSAKPNRGGLRTLCRSSKSGLGARSWSSETCGHGWLSTRAGAEAHRKHGRASTRSRRIGPVGFSSAALTESASDSD